MTRASKYETLRALAYNIINGQTKTTNLEAAPNMESLASLISGKNTNFHDKIAETSHPNRLSLDGYRNCHNNLADSTQPITSLYLMMTRSMGLRDEDALNLVSNKCVTYLMKIIAFLPNRRQFSCFCRNRLFERNSWLLDISSKILNNNTKRMTSNASCLDSNVAINEVSFQILTYV